MRQLIMIAVLMFTSPMVMAESSDERLIRLVNLAASYKMCIDEHTDYSRAWVRTMQRYTEVSWLGADTWGGDYFQDTVRREEQKLRDTTSQEALLEWCNTNKY